MSPTLKPVTVVLEHLDALRLRRLLLGHLRDADYSRPWIERILQALHDSTPGFTDPEDVEELGYQPKEKDLRALEEKP